MAKVGARGAVGLLVTHQWGVAGEDSFDTSITGGQYLRRQVVDVRLRLLRWGLDLWLARSRKSWNETKLEEGDAEEHCNQCLYHHRYIFVRYQQLLSAPFLICTGTSCIGTETDEGTCG